MHLKLKNKLFLMAFTKEFKIAKYVFSPMGIFSQRTILRIGFIQIDIFYD